MAQNSTKTAQNQQKWRKCPYKAKNCSDGLKTVFRDIIHDCMLYWPTHGAIWGSTGAPKWPKQHQNRLNTSQHWFQNNWRNCSRMNILSQKWANISYREQAQIWNYTPSRIRAIFWKMHKARAVTGPRHNTDFRTIDEIIIGQISSCKIGQTVFTESRAHSHWKKLTQEPDNGLEGSLWP